VIEGYALSFYGGYGSGVASIVRRRGCSVWGLLWRITIACEQSLDRYEGFPYLYRKEWHSVVGEGNIGKVRGMVYVMNCDTYALPSDSYFSGIKDGFIDNGIPVTSLVRALEETKARCRLVQGGRHIG
jgi:gamma-glutamylcyclotransferase (GGCT)/AIG2-like uncharacterized protein YtfP